eukprot:TRINITY_DN27560_c0_g1_i1.p1 TRINITY_DN27560_c0_g1~~TRINITY_DN27560_c0_g1_i1.p1  ORF type:complete len:743 (-),score=100.25 TRINITY_DN27560_c0_g1_i1:379-2607(-)
MDEVVPKVAIPWTVPLVCLAVGQRCDDVVLAASGVAAAAELLIWAGNRNKALKSLVGFTRFLPFPLRQVLLLAVQGWFLTSLGPATALGSSSGGMWGAGAEAHLGDANLRGLSDPSQFVNSSGAALTGSAGSPARAIRVGSTGFVVDADPATLRWQPKTVSVILPCAEEREYAVKTVQSVFDTTPAGVLLEIVVVDDGSEPPLSETHMGEDFQKQYKVKIMRHPKTIGLIGAKKTGGDAATGDILVFFDCHVAPQKDWYKSFLRMIAENYRRMVVPQITALNIDTWTQVGRGGGMAKCYLTWDADFKWFDSDDMYIAVISGGLLGMSRRWWQETGGYDAGMFGWGGENLDQSLRMWLCGGEIVNAADSYVAHMWRVGNDQRTRARYKHVGDAFANRARAVYAWYGEFADKLTQYPNFNRRSRSPELHWYGNISNILEVKNRLKCRPFAWFLRRFKHLYEDAGMIPKEVFLLREESTGECLKYKGGAGTSGNGYGSAALAPCDPQDDRMYWHAANKDAHGHCCAGLRAWNTDQCMDGVKGDHIGTSVCDVSGRNPRQRWIPSATGVLKRNDECLIAKHGAITSEPCSRAKDRKNSGWSKASVKEPMETILYNKARKDNPDVFVSLDKQFSGSLQSKESLLCQKVQFGCFNLLGAKEGSNTCLDPDGQLSGDTSSCLTFFFKEGTLRPAAEPTVCLDRMNDEDDSTWGYYECHGGEMQQFNRWKIGKFCSSGNECFQSKAATPV